MNSLLFLIKNFFASMKTVEIKYMEPGEETGITVLNTPGIHKNKSYSFGTLIKLENAYLLDNRTGIYTPSIDDLIIGKIFYKSGDYYKLDLNTYTGVLPSLAFKNATKRFKPELDVEDYVLCRVVKLGDEVLLTCAENDLGKLEGFVFCVEPWKVRKLYFTPFLSKLGEKYEFECAMGMNGRIWINCDKLEIERIIYNEILNYK